MISNYGGSTVSDFKYLFVVDETNNNQLMKIGHNMTSSVLEINVYGARLFLLSFHHHCLFLLFTSMTSTSAGSVTLSGVAVLQSPCAVNPNKGHRNVVFDSNFCIVEGSQTATMGLLRYFASTEMASTIQEMAVKPFQKAFVVANVFYFYFKKMACFSDLAVDRICHSPF